MPVVFKESTIVLTDYFTGLLKKLMSLDILVNSHFS